MESFRTIEWKDNKVIMLDQTKLPTEEVYIEYENYIEVANAIRNMVIRGAPAIGIAAAMGIALGANQINETDKESFLKELNKIYSEFGSTRPTAINLFWAIERMKKVVGSSKDSDISAIKSLLIDEANKIHDEDLMLCKQIGVNGAALINDNCTILTHCNAGGLATAGYGTALGVVRAAFEEGKNIHVYSCETRPFLQGSRLTAWELNKDNIPVTIITDSMAGHLMDRGMIDIVIVGADRIAANGDVANKIGTYSLSVLAKHHNIPFYVAAPVSTLDMQCKSGNEIPIEERKEEEITHIGNKRIAAEVNSFNPAFDITPNENISSIITNKGVFKSPTEETES